MENISTKQLEIIGHSLGVNVYHAKISKLKRDKKLPQQFYRNRFIAGDSHTDAPTLQELVSDGLMNRGEKDPLIGASRYWWVTEKGISIFRENFNKYVSEVAVIS